MTIDLGQALVGVMLAVKIFDEFFKESLQAGVLPDVASFDRTTPLGTFNITVRLGPPDLVLVAPNQDPPRTELLLTGTLEVRPAGQTDGDPIETFPLDVHVLLSFVLLVEAGEVPQVGLRYDGVAQPPSSPLTGADVDAFFAIPEIADTLAAVRIDVLGPAVDGLEPVFFGDTPPARDTWATALRLLPAETTGEMDAVGLFVALPNTSAVPELNESLLPTNTGFGIIYARNFLNVAFAQGAQAQVGQQIQGATITDLSITMGDDAILVDGRAEKDPATITFSGPVDTRLVPGTIVMFQDTSQVDVDVDVPWWADVLLFFRFIPIFWPILIPLAAISEDLDVWKAAGDIEDAPEQVRSGLSVSFGRQLVSLAAGLSIQTDVQSIQLDSTPDSSRIEEGNMLLFAQTFVSTLTETITDAFYSRSNERFVQYVLASGRLFRASELARLVLAGKIVTPGFHDVRGKYMRANPDNALGNNLEEMFGNHQAEPPY